MVPIERHKWFLLGTEVQVLPSPLCCVACSQEHAGLELEVGGNDGAKFFSAELCLQSLPTQRLLGFYGLKLKTIGRRIGTVNKGQSQCCGRSQNPTCAVSSSQDSAWVLRAESP